MILIRGIFLSSHLLDRCCAITWPESLTARRLVTFVMHGCLREGGTRRGTMPRKQVSAELSLTHYFFASFFSVSRAHARNIANTVKLMRGNDNKENDRVWNRLFAEIACSLLPPSIVQVEVFRENRFFNLSLSLVKAMFRD